MTEQTQLIISAVGTGIAAVLIAWAAFKLFQAEARSKQWFKDYKDEPEHSAWWYEERN